jgi:two-component system nitrate/nitrite response regulator NarL
METPLSSREKEILLLIIKECTSSEIARKLELSVRTVETHRKNISRKTASHSLIGLIKYCIREGWVEGFSVVPERSTPMLRSTT